MSSESKQTALAGGQGSGDSGGDEDGEMSDEDLEQDDTVSDFSSFGSEDDRNAKIGNSYREKILISRNLKEEWSTDPHVTKKDRIQARNIFRLSLGPSCYAAISNSSNPCTWKMQVYAGRDPNKSREVNQGEKVVTG